MDDFTPRNYQEELMNIGLQQNTIVFLPTGSGKTFISLMILKRLSGSLQKAYGDGGKISVILVNTIALVEQHAQYINDHTTLNVGQYTGEMNLDFWPKDKWKDEFDKHQVFIMTCQILVNLVNQCFVDLNKINLLIFDECHRGVNDHSMRQLMKSFESLYDPPRVLGLTATLLNGNCKPGRVMDEVKNLETTYHSKVATVEGLAAVVGYSTNPTERFKICSQRSFTYIEHIVIELLDKAAGIIKSAKTDTVPLNIMGLTPLSISEGYKKLANLISDINYQIELTGAYGGVKAILSHMIQIERIKKHCQDFNFFNLINYVLTTLAFANQLLKNSMKGSEKDQIYNYSSDKILQLINIFDEYRMCSKEDLCCIVFTKRRFTAKVIYHGLDFLRQCDPKYSYIKPNFIVGYNNNPYNNTRENLYTSKKNKQILKDFADKEINVIIASDVLEEGVDIPKCTLVIKFDKPENYRSYIQSKGRARHKSSFYYILVEKEEEIKFQERYQEYQLVEQTLNNYLIGKNTERLGPSQKEIQTMYEEDELPPYYVNGPGSAKVNMQSAIPLLCQYCSSLPSDIYTMYTPEWYVKEKKSETNTTLCSVVILLPTICPIVDMIEGEYMTSIKSAKRAAALKACIELHKIGELDDHLQPRKNEVPEADTNFLFTHYPAVKEPAAGSTKNKRLHEKKLSRYAMGQILPNTPHVLHIIKLEPRFSRQSEDVNNSTIFDSYTSPLCFGIITPNKLPVLCDFPIYVSLGTINVSLQVNQKQVILKETDINAIREFHYLIFDDVLKILQIFLFFDNSSEAEMLLLAPVNKSTLEIDFSVINNYKEVKDVLELTSDEKKNLEVTQETYLRKIVSPWYRRDPATYIVTEVSLNKSALSPFPNEDYSSFQEYFQQKHNQKILNCQQPLLLVKGLTKRLNYIKPKGKEGKQKRDKLYEELSEYLIPELVVKQEFPSSLWIQASFLPTILSRISFILQVEELRCTIVKATKIGKVFVNTRMPLELDEHLLNYDPNIEEDLIQNLPDTTVAVDDIVIDLSSTSLNYNKDYAAKMLEAQYPWKDLEEPKDIERDLNVTVMDIEYFEKFISHKITREDALMKNDSPQKKKHQLALTYHKDFVARSIKILDTPLGKDGPELCELYRALTTAKANDVVNLERLETLGDSFLKLITTIYISIRFPTYDEGRATSLKGRMISNKNLYYLSKKRNLSGILKYNDLSPKEEWLPPCFRVPAEMMKRIHCKEVSIAALFNLNIPRDEQISGKLSKDTLTDILEEDTLPDLTDESSTGSMAPFLQSQYVGDKHVADVVESLLGAYLKNSGIKGGIKLVEWIGIIPPSEKLDELLVQPPPDPVLNKNVKAMDKIEFHLPNWKEIEDIIGYQFKNRAYLLQALTHASYTPNRITLSYEKLEFLGDAILDFLITCFIYESCGYLNPGQLTDLRSALVNNNTFASLVVRCGLHKFLLMMNSTLQSHIDKFAGYFNSKNCQIDDEVLILLEEEELNLAEYVDVPKVLGDIFEALAGAVYLDSNRDLKTVWTVFYKIMWKEIDLFSRNVPKNVVRRLFEWPGTYPRFGNVMHTSNNKSMVALRFMLNGREKTVYGCGTNKAMAKKAAAKLALRSLDK